MKCEIITIGDEILIGQTIDTNSAWLGENLNGIGLEVVRIVTIQDVPKRITEALDSVAEDIDLVVITGGLGPTQDDLTKQTLTRYFNGKLVMHKKTLARIEDFFESRGLPMLDVNARQALLPDNALILTNNFGSASGMWFTKNNRVFISLPGVPFEMKGIMNDFGFKQIKAHFKLPFIFNRTILTWGYAESFLAEKLKPWETELRDSGLGLAYLPSPGMVKLRISTKSKDKTIKQKVNEFAEKLYLIIPHRIFGEGKDTLEKKTGELLRLKKKTLSIAESCTGGYLSHLITSVPGCSDYYKGGVISYSNEIKERILKINPGDLNEYGAVSEQVVGQMAKQVRKLMKTDFGLATSGIAGPEGGTEEKPVGSIWIAVSSGKGLKTKLLHLGNHRLNNIRISSLNAMGMLLGEIND